MKTQTTVTRFMNRMKKSKLFFFATLIYATVYAIVVRCMILPLNPLEEQSITQLAVSLIVWLAGLIGASMAHIIFLPESYMIKQTARRKEILDRTRLLSLMRLVIYVLFFATLVLLLATICLIVAEVYLLLL